MSLDDFSFEADGHIYRNAEGIVRPSVTQCLSLGGVFDYSMVPPDVLERKRIIGTNVHAWTAEYDREGDADPTALTVEEFGYARAWMAFVAVTRPQWMSIEGAMLRTIHGMEIAGTPDRIAIINRRAWVIEIKCTAAFHPGWRLQLAGYEMLHTRQASIGSMGRLAVRLKPDGTYVPNPKPFDDPSDAAAFLAFAQAATWMQNQNNQQPQETGCL